LVYRIFPKISVFAFEKKLQNSYIFWPHHNLWTFFFNPCNRNNSRGQIFFHFHFKNFPKNVKIEQNQKFSVQIGSLESRFAIVCTYSYLQVSVNANIHAAIWNLTYYLSPYLRNKMNGAILMISYWRCYLCVSIS